MGRGKTAHGDIIGRHVRCGDGLQRRADVHCRHFCTVQVLEQFLLGKMPDEPVEQSAAVDGQRNPVAGDKNALPSRLSAYAGDAV